MDGGQGMTDYQKYINALRKCAKEHENDRTFTGHIIVSDLCRDTANLLEELEQKPRWIPVKWHEISEEEREREKYPEEWLTMIDCLMPNDAEEILVTIKSSRGVLYVEKDICYVDDGYSLDSGSDWIDDVVAWMPLPEPYKAESEETDG